MKRLSDEQAQALAVQAAMEEQLTEMAADLVPEDDPGYMEALARYTEAAAAEIREGDFYLLMRTDAPPIAYIREPEASWEEVSKWRRKTRSNT